MCFVSLAAAGGLLGASVGAGLGTAAIDVALIGAALSTASSAAQAKAAGDAAKFNSKAAREEGKAARGAASRAAGKALRQGGELASSQRAALGGTGFDVERGDAVSIVTNTLTRAGEDAAEASVAGANQASAAEVRGANARIGGRAARNRAAGQIGGTVLGTVGSVASTWYQFAR